LPCKDAAPKISLLKNLFLFYSDHYVNKFAFANFNVAGFKIRSLF